MQPLKRNPSDRGPAPPSPTSPQGDERQGADPSHDGGKGQAKGNQRRGSGLLTTGDMARLSNNTVRTVRFYEEMGVLQPAHRSEGGHRLFPSTELDKLLFVSDMRAAGLSLDEIRAILGIKASGSTGALASQTTTEVLSQHIAIMSEKIAALSRLRDDFVRASNILAGCTGCHGDPRFPSQCGTCTVIDGKRPNLPLSLRVLWRVGEETACEPGSPAKADGKVTREGAAGDDGRADRIRL